MNKINTALTNFGAVIILLLLSVVFNTVGAIDNFEEGNSTQKKYVQLETELGKILIKLHLDKAPVSSMDFLRYASKGLFNNEGFYRVVHTDNDHGSPKIDIIQGGLLDEKEGLAPVFHETTRQTKLTHKRGTVSLARGEVGTGSAAYFFIVVKDSPGLDFGESRNADKQGFAAFAEVVEGMTVVDKIYSTPQNKFKGEGYLEGQLLKQPVKILDAKILTLRE